jgi:hypothetical protein
VNDDSDRPGGANWWDAAEGKVHELVLPYVRTVERRQSDYFDEFLMYEAHYDPNGPAAKQGAPGYQARLRGIKENVVAIGVDTVQASIAATDVQAEFQTDGGDWSTQRRAKLMERYAEEIGKLTRTADAVRDAFHPCTKKGTGLVRVYADQDKQLHVEPVMVDNIIVDDRECANGSPPRQLHYRQADFDCDALIQQFPDHKAAILRARGATSSGWRRARAGYGDTRNDVLVVESWRLPMGVYGTDRYVPGCHAITIEGADLFREEWHKPHFGMAVVRYFKREGSWYGGGLAERIIGHQKVIDRRRDQQDRQLDYAVPTTYGSIADPTLRVQVTRAGNYVALKGPAPTTVVPQVIGSEIMQQIQDARAGAIAEVGLNEMQTRGVKAPGVESAVAIREVREQSGQRFSIPEKAFERFWLDVIELILDVCKDLGDDAPEMSRMTRFGPVNMPWSEVEIDDVRVMIAAASTLNRTPAGRKQTVLEMAQAGAINLEETRRLYGHPDLEHTISMYTASMEAIEQDLEAIEDGYPVLPEPFVNLDMAQSLAQSRYLVDRGLGAPEEVLEGLRAYAVQAADMMKQMATAAPPMDPMTAGAMPLSPVDLALPAGPPVGPPMTTPQQVPSAGPPTLPAGTGPMAA